MPLLETAGSGSAKGYGFGQGGRPSGPLFNLGSVSSIIGLFDAGDTQTAKFENDQLVTWKNRVNSVDATQTNSGYRPALILRKGIGAANFNGSNWLSMNTNLTPLYMIAAVRPSSTGTWVVQSQDLSYNNPSNNNPYVTYSKLGGVNVKFAAYGRPDAFSNTGAGDFTTGNNGNGSVDAASLRNYITNRLSSNNFTVPNDNNMLGDPAGGIGKPGACITVGRTNSFVGYARENPVFPGEGQAYTVGEGSHFNGHVGEVFLFSSVPSAGDINTVTNYLTSKWL